MTHPDSPSLLVHHAGPQPVVNAPSAHSAYYTVVIPASTAGQPASTAQLLPRDDHRVRAWVQPIDGPIIVAQKAEIVESPQNVGGAYPSGAYGPAGGYLITGRDALVAANPSTTISCRVSIMTETGAAAEH
jgi:hypothetical protein